MHFEALCVQLNGKTVHLFQIIFNKLTPLVPLQFERLAHHGKPSVTKVSPSSSCSSWLLENFDCWIVLPLNVQLARGLLFSFREILAIYTPVVSLAQHIFSCLHSFFAVEVFTTAITLNQLYFTNSQCLYILLDLICTLQSTS